MIPARGWQNKTALVLGLGRSGMATVQSLKAGGAHVLVWDDYPPLRHQAQDRGGVVQDWRHLFWPAVQGLFLSPGIPHHLPQPHGAVVMAQEAGVPLCSDVDLLSQSLGPQTQLIGVTGTNGKSTTTALITHLLTTAGIQAQAGGNIGRAALSLDPFKGPGVYVLEVSSYQLMLMRDTVFASAVLLNLEPDHLERHGDMAGYAQAKERLFHHVTHTCAISVDDPHSREIWNRHPYTQRKHSQEHKKEQKKQEAERVWLSCGSGEQGGDGLFVKDGWLYDPRISLDPLIDLKTTRELQGEHNWQNALGAYAAVRFLSLPLEKILKGFLTFKGLEHRQEKVLRHGTVLYINDSKATNMASALQALKAFDRIYWIVGGRSKGDDFQGALPYCHKICKVYAMGEAASEIKRALSPQKNVEICGNLHKAFQRAQEDALQDPEPCVILLSPACSSFDQFLDFEERGRAFKALVMERIGRATHEGNARQ